MTSYSTNVPLHSKQSISPTGSKTLLHATQRENKTSLMETRFKALAGKLGEINEEMKLIFADVLLQQPPDPFQFVANRLRQMEVDVTTRDGSPSMLSPNSIPGIGSPKKLSPPRLPVLTEKEKKRRRGMEPPDDLIKFYLGSYRFKVSEIKSIFKSLGNNEKAKVSGRLTTMMPVFADVIASNASYANYRMERRMCDRLYDALTLGTTSKVNSYMRIIPACSALAALSIGTIEDRLRIAFYFHGHKYSRGEMSYVKPLPKSHICAQVLANFFIASLKCVQNLELMGLGTHVRSRLTQQYSTDCNSLERVVLIFVRKLFPKHIIQEENSLKPSTAFTKTSDDSNQSAGTGPTFHELCSKITVPSCWMETWNEIWKKEKAPNVRVEHPDIVVARWVKCVLFQNDTAIEKFDDFTFDNDLGLLSPRADMSEELLQNTMATKIQARYRGKVGREAARKKEIEEQNNAAVKMQANFRGHRARMQQAKEFAEQNNAATKIQAIHRGKKARKEIKDLTSKSSGDTSNTPRLTIEEEKEQEQAAIKLQSRMRGNYARKKLLEQKTERQKPIDATISSEDDTGFDNKNTYSSREDTAPSNGVQPAMA